MHKTIRVDMTIDEGVYICPPCVRQHDWKVVPVNVDMNEPAPLCYNCERAAWYNVDSNIVRILEDLRKTKLRLNAIDDEFLYTQYKDAPYDLVARALRRMVEHVYDNEVSDGLVECSYDYSIDEDFDWNGRADSLRDIVLDWRY